MNSFETDLKRAVCSKGFALCLALELAVLFRSGFDSGLFRAAVPVLAAVPYSAAWLADYQSGYIKEYLPRTGRNSYILGKFFSCGISGGFLELAGCGIYLFFRKEQAGGIDLTLVFMSGMLWAVCSATLAAWSNSRYIAYGGAFVIYYLLVILNERYFKQMYCLYPYEWISPSRTWVFGKQGIALLLGGIILVLLCCYYEILRRCMERV